MGFEDIEVRITREGEIFVRIDVASEERIRDYTRFLEETVGPILSVQPIDRKDWDRPAGLRTDQEEEEGLAQGLQS